MDFELELARSARAEWLSGTVQNLLERVQKDAAKLPYKDLKIAALTLELAHHKRIRFANQSEAFSPEQRQLFEETWNADLGAIEAEVAQLAPVPKPSRPRRSPPCPRTYRALNSGTSRNPALAASVGATWSRSAKT